MNTNSSSTKTTTTTTSMKKYPWFRILEAFCKIFISSKYEEIEKFNYMNNSITLERRLKSLLEQNQNTNLFLLLEPKREVEWLL